MIDHAADRRPALPMPVRPDHEVANVLLRQLPAADLALLAARWQRLPFRVGDVLARAGASIDGICFPEAGIAGILDTLAGDGRFAIGLVGREGFVGWPLLLGDDRWPHDVVMRAEAGDLLWLPATALADALARSGTLRDHLLRFAGVFMVQMSRTVVSALVQSIEQRMARWLLMYHDRLSGDDICMTHEEFGLMLGVRRSSITDALHRLEEEQAIRAHRGRVIVVDRNRLVQLAGDTYGRAEQAYRRLIAGEMD